MNEFHAFALTGIPEIRSGDDLTEIIQGELERTRKVLQPSDIVVLAQKIVSKSEGRLVRLADYEPSDRAIAMAREIGKDPRKVEAILSESIEVIRAAKIGPEGLLIVRNKLGWICANAGIDESNIGSNCNAMALLLPKDPDESAHRIQSRLEKRYGTPIGVVVTDTFGRPWRNGLVNVAIGVAGVPAIVDWSGRPDAYGRRLKSTNPAFADEVAAAAGLVMKKDARTPVVVLRGLQWPNEPTASARDVLRPPSQELFV